MTTLGKAAPVILAALAASVLSVALVASDAPGPVPSAAPGPVPSADPGVVPSAPCYDGVTPWNPYANNCGIPYRPPHVRGGAPDQTALINCSVGSRAARALCLSQYVNGP
jgi:hypothetical protein